MPRNALSITLSVWKALFLREALVRLFSRRAAWIWLFGEPLSHIIFFMFIFSVMRVHSVGGIDTAVWIMVGMLGFFMFRRTGMLAMKAVTMNRPLFTYRQVKPVDTVLVRGATEGLITLGMTLVMLTGAGLAGLDVVPEDPLLVLGAFTSLWLIGLGFGLVTSVLTELIPEIGDLLGLVMTPLYFLSGVIFPITSVPQPYREWVLMNPVAHAIETVRMGFAPHYNAIVELDSLYPYEFALVAIVLGLMLHRSFAVRLVIQ